jgi:hypothetical protein
MKTHAKSRRCVFLQKRLQWLFFFTGLETLQIQGVEAFLTIYLPIITQNI